MMANTTIIAEIGENHHGDWDIAAAMVEAAAQNGADIVKFQSYLPEELSPDDPEYDWFKQVFLPEELHFVFKEQIEELGAEFMSSPFTANRAEFLCEEVGCESIKVASPMMMSFEMLDVINSHAGTVKRVYLSTGMATIDEIEAALAHLEGIEEVAILHCVTQYPTPARLANLRAITTLSEAFPENPIGYSDHTAGILACLGAVALGATVLEKHFTFSKLLPGTDHLPAMLPEELAQLREQADQLEQMRGDGVKAPAPEELAIIEIARSRFHEPA